MAGQCTQGSFQHQKLTIHSRFHAAQKGEPGFGTIENEPLPYESSLAQLSTSSTSNLLTSYHDALEPATDEEAFLTESQIAGLEPFLNPVYLKPNTLRALVTKFSAESSIELHDFLRNDLATSLRSGLVSMDDVDGLGTSRSKRIPPHGAGADSLGWVVKGPPHKHRYSSLTHPVPGEKECTTILRTLGSSLFPSAGFRAWLRHVTTLIPLSYAVESRRFRPGLDYTLAKSEESEPRLDVVLGLTPPALQNTTGNSLQWEDGSYGGWEVRQILYLSAWTSVN